MKTHKILPFSIFVVLTILFTQLGLPAGPTPVYATGGVAQLRIKTLAPIIRIQAIGINQDDNVAIWDQVYAPTTNVLIPNWWWRFKWFFPGFPDPNTLGPYVWVWYENGSRDNKLCSKPGIGLFSNEETCEFPEPPEGFPEPPEVVVPPPQTNCDPAIYPGILHCFTGLENSIQIIKINPGAVHFETVLAEGYDRYGKFGECRDVNIPASSSSSGPGCILNGAYPRETIETMMKRYPKAVVAFNADLFGTHGEHGPEGLTVKNGARFDGIYDDHDKNEVNRPSLSISSSGNLRIGYVDQTTLPNPSEPWNWNPDPNAYWNTVGGLPILVNLDPEVNSQNLVKNECDEYESTGRPRHADYPDPCRRRGRTAVGITQKGEMIVVVIAEVGTAAEEADTEVTLPELAEIMFNLGATKAINLDGGGSSQLWYDKGYLVKSPEGPDGRPVAEALLVFPGPATSRQVSQTIHILPGETKTLPAEVPPYQAVANSSAAWFGSDVVMTLTTPSGRVISRSTAAQDVAHTVGPTFETYSILDPEPGLWEVSLFGADLPPEGEDVVFTFTTGSQAPLPELAYLDGSTLVLNMGSAERRQARNIQPDEINEEFTVKQLGPDTFSVTAFGLTQVYKGVTSIKADGDDGNDMISLEAGNVPFIVPAEITGGSSDDQITSGDGADTLSGSSGNDKINGGGGDDTISGDEGDDDLNGGGGNDTITGGARADVLHGGDRGDKLLGEADSDKLYGDAGNDTIEGGADNDYLEGNDGADTLRGGDGDDELHGQAGADEMYGDAGQDKMYGGDGDDRMDGGADADDMEGNGGADTMHGSGEDDEMYGNAGADEMYGDDGKDTMYGNAGNDTMHGGAGDDHMEGNEDADILYGDDGQDTMYGNTGNDAMHGGAADDYMEGNEDNDTLYGDDGQDDMIGGTPLAGTPDGQDTLYGGADQDVIVGDNGRITRPGGVNTYNGSAQRDVVLYDVQVVGGPPISAGVSGDDRISGDDGDDMLFGQGGNDTMSGGAGNDYLEGNAGADIMNGDAGQDDMIGGGSANDGVIDADRRGDGLLDMGDELHGGDAGDVMTGDDALITRPVDSTGHWLIDPNTGESIRQIILFDVEVVGGPAVNPVTSGSDLMFGDAGEDKLFGQGNGSASDAVGSDPPDGVDNDRNGRENGSVVSLFDCLDGRDNDGDGLIDTADPQCAAAIDSNPGGDEMHGGPGDDYMEGNHGSDWMFGDDGEDDMLGGNSAGDGVIGGPVPPTGLRDGNDVMNGNSEDDSMLGDNGQIVRPDDANSLNQRLTGGIFNLAIRNVTMAQTPEPAGAYGNDWMSGGDGHDDMYGQLGNDYLEGNDGEDAMVGDLGKITNNLIGGDDGIPDPGVEQRIAPNAPFFDPGELIYKNGSLYRQVELYTFLSGSGGAGNDTLYGDNGDDRIHSGPGDDIVNGNAGDDVIYTGDDSDAAWGGPGHDIQFGGYGIDYLDVLPRPARADKKDSFPDDPPTWFEAAKVDNYQGLDIMYGGWDRDWMQADVSAPGRVNGDRMIDWAGGFNAYYRCDAAYGDWVITRQHSPSLVAFLQALAQGHGAINTATADTSGFRETAIVFSQEIKYNANSPNPDNPAHFICGPAK